MFLLTFLTAILGQYFTFLQLGFQGYKDVMINDLVLARKLSYALENSGYFKVLSDVHRKIESETKTMIEGAKDALGVTDEEDALLYKQCVFAPCFLSR